MINYFTISFVFALVSKLVFIVFSLSLIIRYYKTRAKVSQIMQTVSIKLSDSDDSISKQELQQDIQKIQTEDNGNIQLPTGETILESNGEHQSVNSSVDNREIFWF